MTRILRPVPLVVLAGVAALLALLAYGIASNETGQSIDSKLAQGERPKTPAVKLPPLDGKGPTVTLPGDYAGKVVVLNFWASWCPPCKDEAPVLARWQPRLAKQNATIVGVDVLDVTGDARLFIEEHDLDFPHLRDPDGSRLKNFEIVAYPETIVLDRKGRIAATSRGTVDERFFEEKVEPLLKESS